MKHDPKSVDGGADPLVYGGSARAARREASLSKSNTEGNAHGAAGSSTAMSAMLQKCSY